MVSSGAAQLVANPLGLVRTCLQVACLAWKLSESKITMQSFAAHRSKLAESTKQQGFYTACQYSCLLAYCPRLKSSWLPDP